MDDKMNKIIQDIKFEQKLASILKSTKNDRTVDDSMNTYNALLEMFPHFGCHRIVDMIEAARNN